MNVLVTDLSWLRLTPRITLRRKLIGVMRRLRGPRLPVRGKGLRGCRRPAAGTRRLRNTPVLLERPKLMTGVGPRTTVGPVVLAPGDGAMKIGENDAERSSLKGVTRVVPPRGRPASRYYFISKLRGVNRLSHTLAIIDSCLAYRYLDGIPTDWDTCLADSLLVMIDVNQPSL